MPISFFKKHKILSVNEPIKTIFESSGTTGPKSSRHYITDPDFYLNNSLALFENEYGNIENYHILALLPSYLERGNSSLVFMIQHFIQKSQSLYSDFFGTDLAILSAEIAKIKSDINDKRKILLWGVTYALLDLIDNSLVNKEIADRLIVLETGGMKGRRKEMIKSELHEVLKTGFDITAIHSEYGMTELISQAYSIGDGVFRNSKTLKVVIREVNDPFAIIDSKLFNKTGGINIIDLANLASCSFIETQDLGQYGEQADTFKILGRFDNSDIRGCNLLIS